MPSRSLETILARYPGEVRSVVLSARALILKALPDVQETVDASAPVIGFGYGTGTKGTVCTLILSKTGVKLGLAYGATLPDPDHLTAGSGRVHRFVQVRVSSDLRQPSLP